MSRSNFEPPTIDRDGRTFRPKQNAQKAIPSRTRAYRLIPSRYNFQVAVEGGVLLYNTNSGALIRLDGQDGHVLADILTKIRFRRLNVSKDTYGCLLDGGFLVPENRDEVSEVRQRFWQARIETPIVLTITTTQDCNLGCFYCYEERSGDQLGSGDLAAVVESARSRLVTSGKRSLHVDWYGGEPMLNVEFLEEASEALQDLCQNLGVSYHASVISNGTRWPSNLAPFVRRHAIRQVQISFDGMRERHDRSRRFRPGYAQGSESSFDDAVKLVDSLLDEVRVDLRLNLGSHNMQDIRPFLDMARGRGWFRKKFPAAVQPARLSAFTDECGFLRSNEIPQTDFDRIRAEIRETLACESPVEECEAPDGLPLPKTSVCAALAKDSVVIGADGLEYRCGLQVGQPDQASGRISPEPSPFRILKTDSFPEQEWWETFDPTTLPSCSSCSFLPICLGGCAFKHLRRDEHAIAEQGAYWRGNLPRLIAARAGTIPNHDAMFSESDQFRYGKRLTTT